MPTPHDEMWEKLDLDLAAHEGLLQVLGKFYGDIYLSQSGRLKGMEYLDFVLSEVHGLRIKELQEAKAQGKKVIGTFCVFVPEELVPGCRRHPGGSVRRGRNRQRGRGKDSAPQHLRPDQILCGLQDRPPLPLHRVLRPGGGRNHL